MRTPFTKKAMFPILSSIALKLLTYVLLLFSIAFSMASQCYPCDPDSGLPPNGHICVIVSGDHVRCWGSNYYGQLGYGHTSNIGDAPADAGDVNVGGTVTQITVTQFHTCALLDTGTVRCWGQNRFGRLGYGHTNNIGDDETPADAGDVNVGGTVTQIAAGYSHTCALLDTGTVRCWGSNSDGQLGYGHTNKIGDDETPADAGDINVGGTVTQITAGNYRTCALLDTGTVRCWGSNSDGQLGYGHTNKIGDDETPADAGDVNVGGTVTQITAGNYCTCALLDTGTVRCWGSDEYGQLGYKLGYRHTNNIGDDETPADAGDVNVGGTVTQITAGTYHTCALLDTGTVRCWGGNESGVLGYGHTNNIGDDETPADAGDVNVGGTVTQIAAKAHFHTCALLDTGIVRCWGDNSHGQLGYGHTNNIGDDEAPADVGEVDVGAPVIKLWGDLLR